MRFRTTALPSARGQVKPICGPSGRGSRTQNAAKKGPVNREPSSYTLRKSLERSRRTRFGKPEMRLPLGAYGQFLAPARAAPGQNGASVLGLHSGAKPVRLGAVAIIRLKSTFRHVSSSI